MALAESARRSRHLGRQQAAPGALEQHHPQLVFQLGDVAAQGGLGGAQRPRGAQQAAMVERGKEGADEAPVELVIHS